MRGIRDGRPVTYDQEPPPAEGVRPASDAVVGEPGLGVHVDIAALRVEEVRGAPAEPLSAGESLYVLEGELTLGELRAPAGAWVDVPPGASVVVPEPTRYLRVTAPR